MSQSSPNSISLEQPATDKEPRKLWEVTIKDGMLTCFIDLMVPDAVTMALGVADRIKQQVLGMESRALMQKEMDKMKNGLIKPGTVMPPHPGGHA